MVINNKAERSLLVTQPFVLESKLNLEEFLMDSTFDVVPRDWYPWWTWFVEDYVAPSERKNWAPVSYYDLTGVSVVTVTVDFDSVGAVEFWVFRRLALRVSEDGTVWIGP